MMRIIVLLLSVLLLGAIHPLYADTTHRNRLIVLTDMGADPDDQQSLIRLLLYSNQINIEGLVATTSVWQKNRVRPDFITDIIQAYGAVRDNLARHEDGYPSTDELLAKVKSGRPVYGMNGVGDGQDSEGSDWIIEVLERNDPRPVWVSVWGGVNTLSQALYRIRATRSAEAAERLYSKLRVYTISDQDDSGAWIRRTFTGVHYIVSPGDDYGSATWTAINGPMEGINNEVIGNRWLADNIQQGHGPLGAAYPDVSWGMEGDTPAYLSLIPNGLNAPEHPDWGGWGGRYQLRIPDFHTTKDGGSDVVPEPETRGIWTDTIDHWIPYVYNEFGRAVRPSDTAVTGNKATIWRWREDFQNDFAARMDWAVADYQDANHPPVPVLAHPDHLTVKSGQGVSLDAGGTTDPDGDSLSFLWFHYPEAGSYPRPIQIGGAENARTAHLTAPQVERDETAHFILKVTDKGSPPLSRYKRIIVTIEPR